jgi:hypothetical protein
VNVNVEIIAGTGSVTLISVKKASFFKITLVFDFCSRIAKQFEFLDFFSTDQTKLIGGSLKVECTAFETSFQSACILTEY